jgi:hypothetical protein
MFFLCFLYVREKNAKNLAPVIGSSDFGTLTYFKQI